MKKIFLYTMLACMAVSFGSCSDDPMDATEKHVYGENENPYLRTDASATIAYTAEFRKGHVEAKTIRLSDYAETIQTKLGMTVDELMSALESGNAVFYNINPSLGQWNTSATLEAGEVKAEGFTGPADGKVAVGLTNPDGSVSYAYVLRNATELFCFFAYVDNTLVSPFNTYASEA